MPYNLEKAAAELMIDPDELIPVLEFFFVEAREALSECERASANSDFESLKKLFHSLKGSSANFRMEVLRDLASRMEAGSKSGDLAAVLKLLPVFRENLSSIQEQVTLYGPKTGDRGKIR